MAKRTTRVAIAAIGAAAALFAASAPAHAISYNGSAHASNYCGSAKFRHYGETFDVWDDCSDGRGVRVKWQWQYANGDWSDVRYIHYRGGMNIVPAEYDYELPENRSVRFWVGLEDEGVYVSGSYGPIGYANS